MFSSCDVYETLLCKLNLSMSCHLHDSLSSLRSGWHINTAVKIFWSHWRNKAQHAVSNIFRQHQLIVRFISGWWNVRKFEYKHNYWQILVEDVWWPYRNSTGWSLASITSCSDCMDQSLLNKTFKNLCRQNIQANIQMMS